MSDIDDVPLVRAGDSSGILSAPPPPQRTRATPIVIVAVIGLALGAVGAWWWARQATPPAKPAAQSAGTEAALKPDADSMRPLPALDQMDTFLRALLGPLSSSPELARWLATDDLIRQMANGIDRLSNGTSPARDLHVLKPTGGFTVTTRRNEITLDPASYRRYDGLAALVSSLDARAVADAYRIIRPRLDEAYRALGRTDSGVDPAVDAALQLLIDTPDVPDPVRLVHGTGVTYAFANPRLESLAPAQKQLIRMGPENLTRIRARLREIKEAIDTGRTR